MGQKSSIDLLSPELKAELDSLIAKGQSTIDELVDYLQGAGADVSRSAVGRYAKKAAATIEHYKHAQEAASLIIADIGNEPDSKTGQLLAELLKTLAFQTLISMQGQEDDTVEPKQLRLLAQTLRDLATSQKTDQEFRTRIRDQFREEMAARAQKATAAIDQVARKRGLSDEDAAEIRAQVLGIVS